MVATAQSEQLGIFLRKIGYSVGLEFTAERVRAVTELYLQNRDITSGSWLDLVTGAKDEGKWGRNESAARNIADFFSSLRLLQQSAGDILILENLDAMAVACDSLHTEEEKKIARDFILLWAIITNDGEVFVNLLIAGFERSAITFQLQAMIEKKRARLFKVFGAKFGEARINAAVTIERQEKNKGSAGASRSIQSLKRTEPLSSSSSLTSSIDKNEEIFFSDDYFKKVPPRREDWARSLGLWEKGSGLTDRGREFIERLRGAGFVDKDNLFIFWPMQYELTGVGLKPDLLGGDSRDLWSCLIIFANAFNNLEVKKFTDSDVGDAVELFAEMIAIYKSLHGRKSMLRREMPATVAYPAFAAVAAATNQEILDLPSAIAVEQKGDRRLARRRSRISGYAFSVKI